MKIHVDQAELLLEKTPVDGEQGIAVLEQLAEVKLKLTKWGEAERIAQKIKKLMAIHTKQLILWDWFIPVRIK